LKHATQQQPVFCVDRFRLSSTTPDLLALLEQLIFTPPKVMNFIFLAHGITLSVTPILTLIEHKPEHIVGCVLITGQPPGWFIDSTLDDNPAETLLRHADDGGTLTSMHVFLIVKEPNSLLQLSVLAAVGCCNLNYSGEGGRGGRAILKLLAKQNIPTYPAEIYDPDLGSEEEIKKAFMDGFNVVANRWLPECWDLPTVFY
jgi:hypothetical protein